MPFHIHIDASDYAIGVVLGQKVDSVEHAIYFISKNLEGAQFNYIVTEKELLALIYTLNKFSTILLAMKYLSTLTTLL